MPECRKCDNPEETQHTADAPHQQCPASTYKLKDVENHRKKTTESWPRSGKMLTFSDMGLTAYHMTPCLTQYIFLTRSPCSPSVPSPSSVVWSRVRTCSPWTLSLSGYSWWILQSRLASRSVCQSLETRRRCARGQDGATDRAPGTQVSYLT